MKSFFSYFTFFIRQQRLVLINRYFRCDKKLTGELVKEIVKKKNEDLNQTSSINILSQFEVLEQIRNMKSFVRKKLEYSSESFPTKLVFPDY